MVRNLFFRFPFVLIFRYETNLNLAPDNIAKYLAIHWKKAENTKKAIIYYAKAAENFIRVHCYRDATMFLGKANLLHASLKSIDDITDNMNNFIKWYEPVTFSAIVFIECFDRIRCYSVILLFCFHSFAHLPGIVC